MKKDFYYFHNIQATILFSYNPQARLNWLNIKGGGFSFYENRNKQRRWPNASYFPVSIFINSKHWADFDIQRKKLHVVTKGGFENQLNTFATLLKLNIPDLVIKDIKIKYVEICTRYPDKYFNEVSNKIKKVETRFFTTDRYDSVDRRIKGEIWVTIGRVLSIDNAILNVKTYRFVEDFKTRKQKISEKILPKIEVQIYNPKNLVEAKEKAIPIIKAFQEHVGFNTVSMDNESDYTLIQDTSSLYHNTKLLKTLKNDKSNEIVVYPKEIREDELVYRIACFITPKAKNSLEIMEYMHINRPKLAKVIKILEPYLEKRGNTGIGMYYQIDTDLIKDTLDDNIAVPRYTQSIPNNTNLNTNSRRASSDK